LKDKREVTWRIKVAAVDSAERRERCTKRRARNVKKSAKFLLNPEKTVLSIARIVFLSVRMLAAKEERFYITLCFGKTVVQMPSSRKERAFSLE
jgi:hypothetical protein